MSVMGRIKDRTMKTLTNYDEGSIIWLIVTVVSYVKAVVDSLNSLIAARKIEREHADE